MASTPLRSRACKGRRLAQTKTLSCAVPSPHVLAAEGKAPDRPRHQGLPRPCVGDPGGGLLGRTQPNKSAHGAPVPSEPRPSDGRPQPTPPRHALLSRGAQEPGGACGEAGGGGGLGSVTVPSASKLASLSHPSEAKMKKRPPVGSIPYTNSPPAGANNCTPYNAGSRCLAVKSMIVSRAAGASTSVSPATIKALFGRLASDLIVRLDFAVGSDRGVNRLNCKRRRDSLEHLIPPRRRRIHGRDHQADFG